MLKFMLGDKTYTISKGLIHPFNKKVYTIASNTPASDAVTPNIDKPMVDWLFAVYRREGIACRIVEEIKEPVNTKILPNVVY